MFCYGKKNDSNAEIGEKFRNNITANIMQPLLAEKLPVFPVIRCTFSPFFVQHSYIMWSGSVQRHYRKVPRWEIFMEQELRLSFPNPKWKTAYISSHHV